MYFLSIKATEIKKIIPIHFSDEKVLFFKVGALAYYTINNIIILVLSCKSVFPATFFHIIFFISIYNRCYTRKRSIITTGFNIYPVTLIVKVVVSKKLKKFVGLCSSCLSGFTMTKISCK